MKKISFIPGVLLCLCTHLSAQNTPWSTTGSIGIGTTTPQALLDVNGNVSLLTGSHRFYMNSGASFDPSIAGIRNNTGNIVLNAKDGGTLYLNRDVSADTRIQSTSGSTTLDVAVFKNNGNVGIGYSEPTSKLQVNGNIYCNAGIIVDQQQAASITGWFRGASGGNANIVLHGNAGGNRAYWLTAENDVLKIGIAGGAETPGVAAPLNINYMGNVGIGTLNVNDGNYKLFVETGIRTRKIKVDISTWADYVFDNSYTLRPLSEVENFIKKYQHLPDVPSAAEVAKDGIDLGANQAVLLKKIEELTLYLIEQKNKIELLEEENKRMDDMQKRLNILEEAMKHLSAQNIHL